jgi:hypothetical protein
MSEMVERVALIMRAACAQPDTWENRARAAIEAMREPTEAMIAASNREWDGRMSHRSSGAWRAMIDAALAEPDAP